MELDHERLVFLDFEACSLSQHSWPIEIGMSRLVPAKQSFEVVTWDALIQPHPAWPQDAWSSQSAEIHGITRAELAAAPPAEVIARVVEEQLRGKFVISDSPPHETYWLNTLLSTIGPARHLLINDFDQAVHSVFKSSDRAIDMVYETMERTRVPHRAGPDSARLAKSWARGVKECVASPEVRPED